MSRKGSTERASTKASTRPVTLPFRLASSAANEMMKVTFTISAGSTWMLPTWIHEVAPERRPADGERGQEEQEAARRRGPAPMTGTACSRRRRSPGRPQRR